MKRKTLCIFLSLCMILSISPITALAESSYYDDISGHWAEDAIDVWTERGVLKGEKGQFRPDDPITRAELAAVLNRVIGYTMVKDTTFADVPSGAWYYDDVAKLYSAGIMQGSGGGVMRPNANITREEAVVLFARAFDIEENAGNESPFPDADSISGWASALVDGMKVKDYISGDSRGNFKAKASMTRAEVVTILSNIIDDFFYNPGEADDSNRPITPKNAVVRTTDVMLKNYTLTGDLYIMEGVDSGDVTLINPQIAGTTFIRGGGPNSIDVSGGSLGTVILDSLTNPHLDLSKETKVQRIYLNNTASITYGSAKVSYDAVKGIVTFGGIIDNVTLNPDGSGTIIVGDIVCEIVPPEGTINTFELAKDAKIGQIITYGLVNITGSGKIERMEVHGDGVVIDKTVDVKTERIWVADGVKITVHGKDYIGEGKYLPRENSDGNNPPSVPLKEITFTAVETGGLENTKDSTGIAITFSSTVTGLTADNITITDSTGAVVKGALSEASGTGVNDVWTIALTSVTAQGDVTVDVADFDNYDVVTQAQTVAIYMLYTLKAYEDALPEQHLYGNDTTTMQATRMVIDPLLTETTDETVVNNVVFKNFPEGSKVYLGEPNNGGQDIANADQKYTFPETEIANTTGTGAGIWFIAPTNDDKDVLCYIDVTYRNTVTSTTHTALNIPIRIIVDAVADQPQGLVISGTSVTQGQLEFTLEAEFDDCEDGSETHYFLVEKLSGWSSNSYTTESIGNVEYFRIPVDTYSIINIDPDIVKAIANVTVKISVSSAASFTAKIYAVAQETPTDRELDYENNLAYSAQGILQYNP